MYLNTGNLEEPLGRIHVTRYTVRELEIFVCCVRCVSSFLRNHRRLEGVKEADTKHPELSSGN